MEVSVRSRKIGNCVKSVIVALAITAGGNTMAHAEALNYGRATWDTFWFGGYIVEIGLEKLGYTVNDPKNLNTAARFSAVANGDLDFETDANLPNSAEALEKFGDDIVLLGPLMDPGSIQGYLVDRKTAEEHGLTHLEQLRDKEIAKIFDTDGDGKADLVGSNPGWASEATIEHHLDVYGLRDTVEHRQGEYNILVGDVVTRYNAGKPVLLYAWQPNTATVQLKPDEDLVWLQVEKTDLPTGEEDTSLSGIEGCAGDADPCNTGWASTEYYIGANREWIEANPKAEKLFNLIKISLPARVEQNIRMHNGEDSPEDLRRHAEEWIAEHQEQFDEWIAEAKAAE